MDFYLRAVLKYSSEYASIFIKYLSFSCYYFIIWIPFNFKAISILISHYSWTKKLIFLELSCINISIFVNHSAISTSITSQKLSFITITIFVFYISFTIYILILKYSCIYISIKIDKFSVYIQAVLFPFTLICLIVNFLNTEPLFFVIFPLSFIIPWAMNLSPKTFF